MSFDIPKTMKVVGFENSENLNIHELTLCCAVSLTPSSLFFSVKI